MLCFESVLFGLLRFWNDAFQILETDGFIKIIFCMLTIFEKIQSYIKSNPNT